MCVAVVVTLVTRKIYETVILLHFNWPITVPFPAVALLQIFHPSATKPTSTSSETALDDERNPCLFACPYYFNPVCGSDGVGYPQLFANGCFMMAYSCETRRGEEDVPRDYCLLYNKIMHNCLSIYSSSPCVSFHLSHRLSTRRWKPVHGEWICRHIISVHKVRSPNWHKWKINWVLSGWTERNHTTIRSRIPSRSIIQIKYSTGIRNSQLFYWNMQHVDMQSS